MDAAPVTQLPQGDEWIYEIKFDGYRIQAHKHGGDVTLYSRRGKDFTERYPDVVAGMSSLQTREFILDGEIVALDERGRHVFNLLQRSGRNKAPVHFYAFDILWLDGKSLTAKPLSRRREILESVVANGHEHIHLSPVLDAAAETLLGAVQAQGFEGIMAKRWDSIYASGDRPGSWQKHKVQPADDFVVGGYMPGSAGMDELIVGRRDGKRLHYMASVRAGFVPRTKRRVLDVIKPLRQERCPFDNLPEKRGEHKMDKEKMAKTVWTRPIVLAEIAFNNVTPDGHLRHARFVRLREDGDQ